MDELYSLEKLEVYQLANVIGEIVRDAVAGCSYIEKGTVGKQIVKSSDSIGANISEAYLQNIHLHQILKHHHDCKLKI